MDDEQPAPSPAGGSLPPHVSIATIFWIFFQIGALGIGGGLTAWLYREIVDKRRLMTSADFIGALTLAQVLPGINMTNLSVYVGQRLRGVEGALAAIFGLLLAPFFAIIAIGTVYAQLKSYPAIHHFLDGMAAVAVGLLLSMGIKSIKVTNMKLVQLVIMAIVALTVGVLRWPMVPVILVMAPISVALAWQDGRDDEAAGRGDAADA